MLGDLLLRSRYRPYCSSYYYNLHVRGYWLFLYAPSFMHISTSTVTEYFLMTWCFLRASWSIRCTWTSLISKARCTLIYINLGDPCIRQTLFFALRYVQKKCTGRLEHGAANEKLNLMEGGVDKQDTKTNNLMDYVSQNLGMFSDTSMTIEFRPISLVPPWLYLRHSKE